MKSFDKKMVVNRGFTIVELLIVIVVIGILAAIVIVAFNGVQNRANVAAVQSDLKNFGQKASAFYAENGTYPTSSQLASLGWKVSKNSYQQGNGGNALYCGISSGSNARFTIAARTTNNTAFTYSSDGGMASYTGAWTGAWGTDCPLLGYATSDPGLVYAQGYHPANWGTPGWKTWTGVE